MSNRKIRLGITQGDINGVGYEVILRALSDPRILELFTPVIYGSSRIAEFYRQGTDIPDLNINSLPTDA
ncbi:MAG: 4-hydroxythreonine-4-phosphate dehydrogenase PdxA, partial [Paramuribaculum sp.]|nr:4-hydroxythreonine-4-phosphate dehydrogenase PdxA [Paramuribaculum sp.]